MGMPSQMFIEVINSSFDSVKPSFLLGIALSSTILLKLAILEKSGLDDSGMMTLNALIKCILHV